MLVCFLKARKESGTCAWVVGWGVVKKNGIVALIVSYKKTAPDLGGHKVVLGPERVGGLRAGEGLNPPASRRRQAPCARDQLVKLTAGYPKGAEPWLDATLDPLTKLSFALLPKIYFRIQNQ